MLSDADQGTQAYFYLEYFIILGFILPFVQPFVPPNVDLKCPESYFYSSYSYMPNIAIV